MSKLNTYNIITIELYDCQLLHSKIMIMREMVGLPVGKKTLQVSANEDVIFFWNEIVILNYVYKEKLILINTVLTNWVLAFIITTQTFERDVTCVCCVSHRAWDWLGGRWSPGTDGTNDALHSGNYGHDIFPTFCNIFILSSLL